MKKTSQVAHVNRYFVIGGIVALVMAMAAPAAALDSRTEYLIDLLKNSGNFRSRVQAVETLGQIASTTTDKAEKKLIFKALKSAAVDKNESVRMMVAAALGLIGDESNLKTLEKLSKDKVSEVKKAALSAIEKIKKKTAAGDDTAALMGLDDEGEESVKLPLTFYIGIGSWSDKKAGEFADLKPKSFIKKSLKKKLNKMSVLQVAPDGAATSAVKKQATKKKLTPFVLTGSVSKISLDEGANKATAKLQMVVLTGEGNMAMMLSATGAASVESKGAMNEARRKDLVNSAILSAINGLTDDLHDHFKKEVGTSKKKKGGKKKKKGGKKKKKGK